MTRFAKRDHIPQRVHFLLASFFINMGVHFTKTRLSLLWTYQPLLFQFPREVNTKERSHISLKCAYTEGDAKLNRPINGTSVSSHTAVPRSPLQFSLSSSSVETNYFLHCFMSKTQPINLQQNMLTYVTQMCTEQLNAFGIEFLGFNYLR